jgi:hypothetical protein
MASGPSLQTNDINNSDMKLDATKHPGRLSGENRAHDPVQRTKQARTDTDTVIKEEGARFLLISISSTAWWSVQYSKWPAHPIDLLQPSTIEKGGRSVPGA